jgi:hypothetical protein
MSASFDIHTNRKHDTTFSSRAQDLIDFATATITVDHNGPAAPGDTFCIFLSDAQLLPYAKALADLARDLRRIAKLHAA